MCWRKQQNTLYNTSSFVVAKSRDKHQEHCHLPQQVSWGRGLQTRACACTHAHTIYNILLCHCRMKARKKREGASISRFYSSYGTFLLLSRGRPLPLPTTLMINTSKKKEKKMKKEKIIMCHCFNFKLSNPVIDHRTRRQRPESFIKASGKETYQKFMVTILWPH